WRNLREKRRGRRSLCFGAAQAGYAHARAQPQQLSSCQFHALFQCERNRSLREFRTLLRNEVHFVIAGIELFGGNGRDVWDSATIVRGAQRRRTGPEYLPILAELHEQYRLG